MKQTHTKALFHTLLLSVFFCLYVSPSLGSTRGLTLPSDVDYYIHNNPSFSFIFSKDLINSSKDFIYIQKKLIFYDDVYREFFPKELSEKPVYIFASSREQVSNAHAFSIPFLRVLFFPTGAGLLPNMAAGDYSDTVISHEMAHIFQLGQIFSKINFLKKIFKNSTFILLPFPVFLNPNLSMSLFFLEGHAVWSESIFAPGGRLYSGATRALVFAQIKNNFQNTDQFLKNYLLNTTEDTFAGEQPYAHGGYFFSSLSEKHNIKTINRIFQQHAKHFIAPLSFISIKNSFESVFNTSFESLANHYLQKYRPLALNQQSSPAKTLWTTKVCPHFNKNEEEVFFLTSDLKSPPVLRTLSFLNGEWKSKKKNFALGKIFKLKGKYYVSASSFISPVQRVHGLFSEGMFFKKNHSQQTQDIQKGHTLSISTSNNMRHFSLLLNGTFYDTTHSSALFGPDGGIYYFKQQGDHRVLYRNKKPLFQFKGFYGKPVEVGVNGSLYFIASSLYGSTLFAWHPLEGIYRVSPSDTIISAIQVREDQFLVCEVGSDMYSLKLIQMEHIKEGPVLYSYPFKNVPHSFAHKDHWSVAEELAHLEGGDSLAPVERGGALPALSLPSVDEEDLLSEEDLSLADEGSSLTEEDTAVKEHKKMDYTAYHSLKHIRFNGVELGYFRDPITENNALVSIGFRDPLEYSTFHFSFEKAITFPNWAIKNRYINKSYRLAWNLQYIYKQGLENFSGARDFTYVHEFSQGFLFPLVRWGYWHSSIEVTNAISTAKFKSNIDDRKWYFITKPAGQIQYKKSYPKNFDLHRHFLLRTAFKYQHNFLKHKPNLLWHTMFLGTMHWGGDFYTKPFVNYKVALKPKSIPFRYFDSINSFNPFNTDKKSSLNAFNVPPLDFSLIRKAFKQTNNYFSTGLKVAKFIETPVYFSRYPLSIRGLGPFVTSSWTRFVNHHPKGDFYSSFLEWVFGIDTLLLFHHRVKLNIGFYMGFSAPWFSQWTVTKGGLKKAISFANAPASSHQGEDVSPHLKPKLTSVERKLLDFQENRNLFFGIHLRSQF